MLSTNSKIKYLCLMLLCLIVQGTWANEKQLAELVKQIDQVRIEQNVSATVLIVVDRGKVVLNTKLGTSSWDNDQPMTDDQMFRIGSVSKSFAALLALRMQQQGLIDLSKPWKHYVKKGYIKNNYDVAVTLQQLLEHTAGLAGLSKAEWSYNDPKPITIEQALMLNKGNHTSLWQPAMHSSYSNAGAGLLGLALEKASGQSYEQLMDKYVFQPLAMKSSTLLLEPYVKQRLIAGYNTDGKTPIPYWHNIYRPFAAINTDAHDMIQFLQMLLNKGKVNDVAFLSEDAIARMEQPKTTLAAKDGLNFGYGLANYQWQRNGYTFHGHGGDADGYLTRYGYNRQSGLAYFVMVNAFNHKPLRQMRRLLESHIIKDLPKPDYPLRLKLPQDILQSYVGEYVSVTHRFGIVSKDNRATMKVILKDQKLYLQFGGGTPEAIYAVNNKHFRYAGDSVATMAFILHDQGLYFQGDEGNYKKR
jgi:CubicO group peptidase (beta-lactamase class C family)